MPASNRGTRLTKLVTTLKKKFKPIQPAERPLFESLLYACLLENSNHEAAEEAIRHLESSYFDWNEVRVSTRTELTKALKPLNDPAAAADRLKRSLQSVFEAIYAFDLEACKKQNLGQSIKQFTSYDGVTPFAVSYVTQNGLSGHAIALNKGALVAFHVFDLISDTEFKKRVVPGLERAVPKNSAIAVGSLIHQLGVEVGRSPYSPAVRKLLLDIDPTCKDRLPKRAPKPKPEPVKKSVKKPVKKPAAKAPEKAPTKEAPAKKGKAKAAPSSKKPATKAVDKKKVVAKKPVAKKPDTKKIEKKAVKKKPDAKPKTTTKKPAKKKVATKKVAAKKPAAKKVAAKKPAKKKAVAKKGAAKKVAKKKTAKKSAASPKKRKPR